MRGRWSANTWAFLILMGVLGLVIIETSRSMFTQAVEAPEEPPAPVLSFKVGDNAPDFTIGDSSDKPYSLHASLKRETLLSFICGCSECRQVQTYLGKLQKQQGDRFPEAVTVTTVPKDAEASYRRDIPFEQTLLYDVRDVVNPEKPSGKPDWRVGSVYDGHPCPRAFLIGADGKVKWISPSPRDLSKSPMPRVAADMAYLIASELGFDPPYAKENMMTLPPQLASARAKGGRPLAPWMENDPLKKLLDDTKKQRNAGVKAARERQKQGGAPAGSL